MVFFILAYFILTILGLVGGFLWVWVCLEGCLMLVVVVMVKQVTRISCLFEYFIVQIVSSIIFMGGASVGSFLMFMVGFAVKIGVFPFWGWVYRVVVGTSPEIGFMVVSGLQKIVPMWFWWSMAALNSGLVVLSLVTVSMGAVYLVSAENLVLAVISSSLVHTGWLALLLGAGLFSWVVYLLGYLLLLGVLVLALISGYHQAATWGLVAMSGLVPMLGFVLKVFTFMEVGSMWWVLAMFLFVSGVFGLCGYVWPLVCQALWEGVSLGGIEGINMWLYFMASGGVSIALILAV